MLLTIITVTRNDSKRLNKTIESLKNYYENDLFEHIIIDGASTDDTKLIVKAYAKKHKNIIFKSERDSGIYHGMNKGIYLSHGEFVLFLNSGDEVAIDPNLLISEINKLDNKVLDIVCFPYLQHWRNLKIVRYPVKLEKDKMPTSHQGMIFSQKFLAENIYNINYKIAADFDLYHRANSYKIKLIHHFSHITLVEGDGVASNDTYRSYNEYIKIIFLKYGLINGFISIAKILVKSILVRFIKKIISKNAIIKIRSIYYSGNRNAR